MTRFRNAMLDIESLSLLIGAGIMQIGVALFDIEPGREAIESRSFPVRIEPGNDLSDPDTLGWWQATDAALYTRLRAASLSAPGFPDVIAALGAYLDAHGVQQIWSNRLAFDIGQLNFGCQQHGIHAPWRFNRVRDSATAVQLCEDLTGARPDCSKPEGMVAHDAQWDAVHQARVVQAAYARLRAHITVQPAQLHAA